jgi:cytochrome c oxidase accessory protein FixG
MTTVIDRIGDTGAGSRAEAATPRRGLYKKREPIHPQLVHGRWRAIKWAVLVATLGVYYAVPWIRWPRAHGLPQQAVLVDVEHGRFWFFFIHLWAQEVYYLAGLLVMAALALFLATALFGRLWCGYACPQTVWTDLYIAVERLFEGDRNARLRLAKAPWGPGKLARKGGKHLVWIVIAMATGGAWVFYFRDAPQLWRDLWAGQASVSDYLWVGGLTASTYLLAGWMREQVCTYMCPWPRIQGAMLDTQSLQVTYRWDRGEPRGAHKKGDGWSGRGDCVECRQCVVACPMGIDIRNGLQLECINCALCIDACNVIMKRVGRPKGLIAFDTDAAVAARAQGQKPRYRLLRARTVYYGAALALTLGLTGWGLAHRADLALGVLKDRNPLFVRLKDGQVRDGYTLKLENRGVEPSVYAVRFQGPAGATVKAIGLGPDAKAAVDPGEVRALRVFVSVPAVSATAAEAPASFEITDLKTGARASRRTVFQSDGAGG